MRYTAVYQLMREKRNTYAHQLFTGYNNKTNSVSLISAKNNITQADATKEYGYWIEQWISQIEEDLGAKIPTIGHMSVVSIPDLSHLSFEMEYTDIGDKTSPIQGLAQVVE